MTMNDINDDFTQSAPDYSRAAEQFTSGFMVVHRDRTIRYLNASAERLLSVRRENAVGRLCCDLLGADRNTPFCQMEQVLADKRTATNCDCDCCRKSPFYQDFYNIAMIPIGNADGCVHDVGILFNRNQKKAGTNQPDTAFLQIGNFRSASPSMKEIYAHFRDIAEAYSSVLITGETGTGKEVLARTIHESGPRAEEPFVAINCGAFPDTLLESELFGYKSGAFTGADRDKPGRFALAGNGTLFLDEIGDISPAMQVKLLRVLQEHVYEPLGAIRSERTGARIIAATNADLTQMVRAGRFREDFLYRLNVIELEIPPLRRRREDIVMLTEYFIDRLNENFNRRIVGVSNAALKIFLDYSWPGNIRELENIIERGMVYCRGTLLEPEHLPAHLLSSGRAAAPDNMTIGSVVRNSEMQAIEDALEKCGGNRRKAAEMLGIHPASLYRKLKRFQP